jgi:ribosomal-protein-alanine N-acetyltransferase
VSESPLPPVLTTARLKLRPFTQDDAAEVQRLAGDRDIADTTLNIPHPYEEGAAERWIGTHAELYAKGELLVFAVTDRSKGHLVGAVGLVPKPDHGRAELGYWIGKPYWGRGYAAESAAEVVRYGFDTLGLNRIYARYMERNPASGRVMEKIGMMREGLSRQHVKKWETFENLVQYGILREEYQER